MLAPVRTMAIFAGLCAGCVGGAQDPLVELDSVGRNMLDPIREQALAPPRLIERLHLARNAVVADIGAGPGFLSLPLARAVPEGRVIATDLRADYLAVLEQRAVAAGISNIGTRVVRADEPGLERASVDLALLCQVDHALADRAAYFRSLADVLKKDGRIALVNYRRYRERDVEAAERASLEVIDEWSPSPAFFLLVLAPKGARS